MTTPAIIMMIVALLLVWGGLVAALIHLRRHPEEPDDVDEPGTPGEDPPPVGSHT